jgi:hypothetical protein
VKPCNNCQDTDMNAFRCFFGSKLGLAATLVVAAIGIYLIWTHTGHVLAAAPYLLLLACPLMHLFGHGHRHGNDARGERRAQGRSGASG